jgi:hypothetical protein
MFKTARSRFPALVLVLALSAGAAAQTPSSPSPRSGDGRVILDCLGDADGRLSDCKVMLERPAGGPYAKAALAKAEQGLARGKPVIPGGRVMVAFDFPKPTDMAGEHRRLAPGAAPIAPETVGPGETIVTLPYEFQRAGVLKVDLTGISSLYKGVQAPAGSVGFRVGDFSSASGGGLGGEIWCFFPPARNARPLCLMLGPERATVLPLTDPFEMDGGVALLGSPKYVNLPAIEEKPVQIPGDLRMTYRFVGWKHGHAHVERWNNGRKAFTYRLPRGLDGGVRVRTFVGDYRLDPVLDDRARARVSGPLIVPAQSSAAAP